MTDDRPWRCKNRKCGVEDRGEDGAIPNGWIGLRRYPGNREERGENLGVACSEGCAIDVLTDLLRRRG